MLKNINILRPILAILILFLPLYPKFPLLNIKETYVAIRLDDIVVTLSLLVFLIYQAKHHFPILKLKINRLFLVYFLAIFASNLTAFLIYQTTPPKILLLHLFRRIEYMSLFYLTVFAIQKRRDLFFPYLFLLIASLGVSLFGIGQKYFHLPVISTMNEEFSKGQLLQMDFWSRINSTFAGHYDLAVFCSVVAVLFFSFSLISSSKLLKIISFFSFLLSYYILTLTASRVSIFAFLGGALVLLVSIKKYLWIFPITGLVVFSIFNSKDLNQRLIATIPALKNQLFISQNKPAVPTSTLTPTPALLPPIAVISQNPSRVTYQPTATPTPTIIRHRLEEEFPPIDADVGVARSGEIRFNVEWPRAITAFNKNRLTGTGLGSISLATDNDYLRLLGESGLLGTISFLIIIFFFIYQTIFFHRQKLTLTFLSCLLVFLANAIFIDVFEASKTAYLFWIMMGVYYQILTWPKKSS